MQPKTAEPVGVKLLRMKPPLRKERHSRNQNQSPSRLLRVLRVFAVKVQPRIHREAAKSAKSAKISRRKILSCQQRIFGLVVQICVHLCSSVVSFSRRGCGGGRETRPLPVAAETSLDGGHIG